MTMETALIFGKTRFYSRHREDKMNKVNNFDVLKEMGKRNIITFHSYPLDNVQNINAGKDGWGSVQIAISTGDAYRLLNDAMLDKPANNVCLLIWSQSEFEKIKKEMEG